MEKTNTIHNTKNIIQRITKNSIFTIPYIHENTLYEKHKKFHILPFHTLPNLYNYDVEKAHNIPVFTIPYITPKTLYRKIIPF